ncbi:hypothetical protein C1H46_005697 [Malus baccata]|uniref:Pentatricopeptide repeat-containing protein n=1 Tax=Malus baccata TaxID=106549 RepID=A0A540NDN3_MALBA|nr:hypothetical protein C1H46_005697 [Malus baccata]
MIIHGEYAGNLGLHHLEACMDKNKKNERKFTLSKFETGCCVVCHVVLDVDYCKGISDKGGGKLDYGLRLFEKMRIQDVFSWTSIITTYVSTGQDDRAIKAFIRMQEAGVSPKEYTFAGVISRVANLPRVEWSEQLHAHVLHRGLISLLSVGNSIVTMYAKCGRLASVSKVFHEMSMRDIVSWSTLITGDIISWTAMINGYAEHGFYRETIDLFEKIPRVGLKPDSVTFIGVLVACYHAGLVDLGFHYNSMSNDFGINPAKEHYGCMVDLLYQAGWLGEAEDMVKSMPFQQDDVVCLLSLELVGSMVTSTVEDVMQMRSLNWIQVLQRLT